MLSENVCTTALASIVNLRDLGGIKAGEGREVRPGLLFRSAEPKFVDASARSAFETLGIRTVYDMRSIRERTARPNALAAGATVRSWDYDRSEAELDLVPANYTSMEDVQLLMRRLYSGLPFQRADMLRHFFSGLVEDPGPHLFHCAAGKDRTGISAALLLELLGVARSDIMRDFERTNDHMAGNLVVITAYRAERGLEGDHWLPLLRADAECLHTMFQAIEADGAGTNAYFENHLGLGPDQRHALRTRYTRSVTPD